MSIRKSRTLKKPKLQLSKAGNRVATVGAVNLTPIEEIESLDSNQTHQIEEEAYMPNQFGLGLSPINRRGEPTEVQDINAL
jgi:hypothetical protein